MRKGMLEYCVLLTLRQKGACYPNDLITRLAEVRMIVVEGTIYTLLTRLRKEGKLLYEWQESPKGPPRKYYHLTEAGEKALEEMTIVWNELSFAVETLKATEPSRASSDPDSSENNINSENTDNSKPQ